MEWIKVSEETLGDGQRVIAYFPDRDENGDYVSTGVFSGGRVIMDSLTSTAAWFRASHWMPFPNPPAGERPEI